MSFLQKPSVFCKECVALGKVEKRFRSFYVPFNWAGLFAVTEVKLIFKCICDGGVLWVGWLFIWFIWVYLFI